MKLRSPPHHSQLAHKHQVGSFMALNDGPRVAGMQQERLAQMCTMQGALRCHISTKRTALYMVAFSAAK